MNRWNWALSCYDAAALSMAAVLAQLIRHDLVIEQSHLDVLPGYLIIVFIAALGTFLAVSSHKPLWRYASLSNMVAIVLQVAVAISLSLVIAFTVFRLEGIPRSVPILQALIGIAAIAGPRLLIRLTSRNRGRQYATKQTGPQREHLLVVGLSSVTDLYLRSLEELGRDRFIVEGLLTEDASAHGRTVRGVEALGEPHDLPNILNRLRVHGIEISRVVVTVPFANLSRAAKQELLRWERDNDGTLDLFEDRLGFRDATPSAPPLISPQPAASMASALWSIASTSDRSVKPGSAPKLSKRFRSFKRAGDLIGAVLLLIALAPLWICSAILVFADLGAPIVFWQVRPGRSQVPIRIHKFRTMSPAHDTLGQRIPDQARLSVIGRFMRRTRLDELPQLYDVVVGNMSLIGPRPLLAQDMPHVTEWRYSVRPGITGWAQVNGGHLLTPEQKLTLDRWYIENASLALDAKILWLTALTVIRGDRINRRALAQAEQTCDDDVLGKSPAASAAMLKGASL